MTDDIEAYFAQIRELADKIVQQMEGDVKQLGFTAEQLNLKKPGDAIYRLEKDPSNGQNSLVGDWRDDKGIKTGSLQFNSEGHFFVEQDIVQPHPRDKRWFVEAVNAWGNATKIKSEARLIANPE